jgi:hypothetical protein
MKDDGSENQLISSERINYLVNVSTDGKWVAATSPSASNSDGLKMTLFSVRGDEPFLVSDEVALGFGPVREEAPMFTWSLDGKSVLVALKYYGSHTQRTVVLPYRSDRPLNALWPKGLKTEQDVAANPGARVITEADAFPALTPSAYLFWRRATQSNLYRIPIPD